MWFRFDIATDQKPALAESLKFQLKPDCLKGLVALHSFCRYNVIAPSIINLNEFTIYNKR